MRIKYLRPFSLAVIVMTISSALLAQTEDNKQLTQTILHLDSVFWKAYNECDIDKMKLFFADDVEFYHDKGGLTTTSAALFESVKKGLCET